MMLAAEKRQIRAAEYRALALQSAALADATPLDHVREKHHLAAARWTALAEIDERDNEAAETRRGLLPFKAPRAVVAEEEAPTEAAPAN